MNLENVKLDFDFDINQIIEDANELNIEILESEEPSIKIKDGYSTKTFDFREFFNYEFNNRQQHYEGNIKIGELKSSISDYDKSISQKHLVKKRMKIRDINSNSIRSISKNQTEKYLVGVY
ncbi:hypothetical protein ACWEYS_01785 [Staphylococcus xylosus]